jgi:hypothetical protein
MRELILNKLKADVFNKAAEKYSKKLDVSCSNRMPALNHKCQFNAVHAVKHLNAVGVIECVMLSEGEATAHYINLMSDGSIYDFTLGWSWSGGDYRFIRHVPEKEYSTIHEALGNLKQSLCSNLPWYCKILFIDKWDLC